VPPGSALLASEDAAGWLGPLDAPNFTYRWCHPDPRMDALQRDLAALVETASTAGQSNEAIFAAVRVLAEERLGAGAASPVRSQERARVARRPVPHLTEAWFC
jgi:hypothetical protein